MSVDIIVQRAPADRPGEDIVDVLLSDDGVATERGRANINHEGSSRKMVSASGPKNSLMYPCRLTEVIKKAVRYRGILIMYSRSYNRAQKSFTIDSAVIVEAKIPDTRPKVV